MSSDSVSSDCFVLGHNSDFPTLIPRGTCAKCRALLRVRDVAKCCALQLQCFRKLTGSRVREQHWVANRNSFELDDSDIVANKNSNELTSWNKLVLIALVTFAPTFSLNPIAPKGCVGLRIFLNSTLIPRGKMSAASPGSMTEDPFPRDKAKEISGGEHTQSENQPGKT
jgi:hypothetical protein